MTNDGLVAFNQASGLQGPSSCPTSPSRSRRRPTAAGPTPSGCDRHPLLERQADQGIRRPLHVRARLRDRQVSRPVLRRHRRRARCEKNPKRCDLSQGIVADDATKTVAFHLVASDPEFLDKLALPFAYLVPAGTPARDTRTLRLPATGPYMIASYRPQPSAQARAQSVLPRVVEGGATRRLPRRDRRSRSAARRTRQ